MTTTYYTATTLDGFIADEQDSLDWLFVQKSDAGGMLDLDAFLKSVGAMVMGATTYVWVLDHMARTGERWAYDVPCWVMTHRTALKAEKGVRFAAGDVRDVHAAMTEAAGDRGVWVVGGGDLAGQFAEAGLLDEVVVAVAPVTLGAGRPLLPRRLALDLLEAGRNGDFAVARYAVRGALEV